jgi:inner membrane protein involved in colicin E2 resistance
MKDRMRLGYMILFLTLIFMSFFILNFEDDESTIVL